MNKIFLIGRMTKDIELNTKGEGKEKKVFGKFYLAVTRKKDSESTDFIRCVAFGRTAEVLEDYCGKGKRVAVEGNLQISTYEDDEGNTKSSYSVVVDSIDIIDFKNEDDEEDEPKKKKSKGKKNSKKSKYDEDDEYLPF